MLLTVQVDVDWPGPVDEVVTALPVKDSVPVQEGDLSLPPLFATEGVHVDAAGVGCSGFQDGGDEAVGCRVVGCATGGDFKVIGGGGGGDLNGQEKEEMGDAAGEARDGGHGCCSSLIAQVSMRVLSLSSFPSYVLSCKNICGNYGFERVKSQNKEDANNAQCIREHTGGLYTRFGNH